MIMLRFVLYQILQIYSLLFFPKQLRSSSWTSLIHKEQSKQIANNQDQTDGPAPYKWMMEGSETFFCKQSRSYG